METGIGEVRRKGLVTVCLVSDKRSFGAFIRYFDTSTWGPRGIRSELGGYILLEKLTKTVVFASGMQIPPDR